MSDNLNYGIIGNCRSAALVYQDSSIDWCCLPEFDSPSIFAKILDPGIGGNFAIRSSSPIATKQQYIEKTCILVTRFECADGIFEVCDFMPRYPKHNTSDFHAPPEIQRCIHIIEGNPRISIEYNPKLGYALGKTETASRDQVIRSVVKQDRFDTIYLYTNVPHHIVLSSEEFLLKKDLFFVLTYNEKIIPPSLTSVKEKLNNTKSYWESWCLKAPHFKHYNNSIVRSAMTLKLLSYDKTGAILAAPTTSIPESIGEERNWDYRFCWIRDASMVVSVISRLGHERIVNRYLDFIISLIPYKAEQLRIMYGINGEKVLTESTLYHLSGYINSKPVRIGNAAYLQKQHDIYGILLDAIHIQVLKNPSDVHQHEKLWSIVKNLIRFVINNWKLPDKGIWEFRNNDMHFTFSKLFCWVAMDRAVSIAKIFKKKRVIEQWSPIRDEIKADLLKNAWNDQLQSFTQSYESKYLDCSVLLMENYGLIEANDPRFIKTVEAIERTLLKDGLLYRYKNEDDFGTPRSSFTICTFWFINSLIKLGEIEKAKKLFESVLSYGNKLGLFSEDIDFETKRLLGNFPQAYSHLALIEVALNFNEKLDSETLQPIVPKSNQKGQSLAV
ncbi:MAG: glycoside hydrolase family 15 protein [Flavobacteriaceae bacterium]|nr:glycoside hydrolase family 15 protein [Flavobacteriaceae bacterium]